MSAKTVKGMAYCPECYSQNVQQLHWVEINSGNVISPAPADEESSYWCPKCEKHIVPRDKSE